MKDTRDASEGDDTVAANKGDAGIEVSRSGSSSSGIDTSLASLGQAAQSIVPTATGPFTVSSSPVVVSSINALLSMTRLEIILVVTGDGLTRYAG